MKRGIKILLLADSLVTLALGMLGPIYALFVAHIGGDLLDASWAYFAFTFTTGIVIYLVGHWEDHIGNKAKLIVAGYALTTIGCLGYLAVHDQASLLVVQVVLGIAVALLSPAYDSVYSHYVTRAEEASNWGSWESMGYTVTATAALVGGYVAHSFGFVWLFVGMAVFAALGTVASLWLLAPEETLAHA